MELNILLRGQSNSVFFDILGGSNTLKLTLEYYLGFDGTKNRVNLIGNSTPDANGNLTMLGSTAFLPAPNVAASSTWLQSPAPGSDGPFTPGVVEQSMLSHLESLPADVKAAPTAVIWMHNESDASWAGQNTQSWEDGVKYDAQLVRAALNNQSADTVPYLFVDSIPFDPDMADSSQAIKLGMEALVADKSFNGKIATHTGDLNMDNAYNGLPDGTIINGGPHVGAEDVATLAARISRTLVNAFAQYALPGSPLALSGGKLDATGPQAVSAQLSYDGQLIVGVSMDPLSGGMQSAGKEAASGLGWTVRTGDTSVSATSAFVREDGSLVISFASPITAGSVLYYGYGTGRIAEGAADHTGSGYPGTGMGSPGEGNSIYDNQGLPIWASASGIEISSAALPAGVPVNNQVVPVSLFDANWYLAQNPDVKAAGVDPLLHYEEYGWKEGRDPSVLFSTSGYLAANTDVQKAGVDPLLHYLEYGQSEQRMTFLPDPLVNAAYYGKQLGQMFTASDAAESYSASGWKLGLNPDSLFDTNWYLAHNPDVKAAGIDPLIHYEEYGWKEGRDPSAAFSTSGYLAANPDVKAAGVDPLLHYLEYGQSEARAV